MFNPNIDELSKNCKSRYSLTLAIAKRAKEIQDDALEEGDILNDQPVTIAIEEILDGKYEIDESDED